MAELLRMEGAKLIFRNFQGRATNISAEGVRTFCVILDENIVPSLIQDGWNVKRLPARPDDPEQYETPFLQVKIMYYTREGKPVKRPPIVELITSRSRTRLNEATIGQLDIVNIKFADVIIRPYEYAPGKVSAYLMSIYVVAQEDDFAMKYADIPYGE